MCRTTHTVTRSIDTTSWTIVARRRGRTWAFRPVADAPVGTWRLAAAAARVLADTDVSLEIRRVPSGALDVKTRDGYLVAVDWNAAPVATFPTLPPVSADDVAAVTNGRTEVSA